VHTAVFRRPDTARLHPERPAIEDWDFWLRLTREHRYHFTRIHQPTVVYHRIPQATSMIGAVADGATAMADFSALVRQIWSLAGHHRALGAVSPLQRHHVLAGPRHAGHRSATNPAMLPALDPGNRTRLA
jgi:hypothetical protein